MLNPLLAIALIFAAGYPAGLVARRLGLPAITGQILAGVLLGPSAFGVFEATLVRDDLELIVLFAMGLFTVAIGGHLSYRRLHNAKRRILSVALLEAGLTLALVSLGVLALGFDWRMAALLGAISVATAPATVLAVVREEHAKGVVVKTLLASVALDNVLCIALFSVAAAQVALGAELGTESLWTAALVSGGDVLGSILLGSVIGFTLLALLRLRRLESFTGLLLAILISLGAAEALHFSPLLSTLALGVMLANAGREGEEVLSALSSLEPILLTCFFTLAGVELDLTHLAEMGLLGGAYFTARAAGKLAGGTIGAIVGGAGPRVRRHLASALLPQAGVAIGLVVILQGDPNISEELIRTITNVVLATVVLNEIVGPPLVRRAVRMTGEAGKGRRRIVEFLQEEHIMTGLKAGDRSEAIAKLAAFLIRTHAVSGVTVDELVQSIEERERTLTTAIGEGVALPHARVPAGPEITGVMGICPSGIDFGAPDGEPVHVIIMIATPEEDEERHLEVMAAIMRMISDTEIRARLFMARNPEEAFEAIEIQPQLDYNYFLED